MWVGGLEALSKTLPDAGGEIDELMELGGEGEGQGGLLEGELGLEEETGDGALELVADIDGGFGAGECSFAGAAGEGGLDLAEETRTGGDGEVELDGDGEAGLLPDGLGPAGVALGEALLDDDDGEGGAVEGGESLALAGG